MSHESEKEYKNSTSRQENERNQAKTKEISQWSMQIICRILTTCLKNWIPLNPKNNIIIQRTSVTPGMNQPKNRLHSGRWKQQNHNKIQRSNQTCLWESLNEKITTKAEKHTKNSEQKSITNKNLTSLDLFFPWEGDDRKKWQRKIVYQDSSMKLRAS